MQTITFYYRQGGSDKVYQVSIGPKDGGFVVHVAYGRRGSTLRTETKTPVPVDEQTAAELFGRIIRLKKAKGYTESPDGAPYTGIEENRESSGILPQLLNPAEESQLPHLLEAPHWCMQEKHDGKRMLLLKTGRSVRGINRNGLYCGIPEPLAGAAQAIRGDFLLDGESIGERYIAFDLLERSGEDLRAQPYIERWQRLVQMIKPDHARSIQVTITAVDSASRRSMYEQLKQGGAEGVVFKRLDAEYTAGRPASGGTQLKVKFHATASFVVAGTNKAKRSVRLVLFDDVYQKDAGNVTIPPNHPIPSIGDVIEARYLHAFPESGCIYQPVYLGRRDDVMPSDCTTKQLKFKPPTAEEDDSL